MNEPVNGVSFAENYLDIHLREAEKKSESPYLPLKSDFTWVFNMERLPIQRTTFSPWTPLSKGL